MGQSSVEVSAEEDIGFYITWKATFFKYGYAAGNEIGATQIEKQSHGLSCIIAVIRSNLLHEDIVGCGIGNIDKQIPLSAQEVYYVMFSGYKEVFCTYPA